MKTFLAGALALMLTATACGDSKVANPKPAQPGQATPAEVVEALVKAYKDRSPEAYAKLLADDFTFYFDPATRPVGVPLSWTRLEDSTGTSNLFGATRVTDIRISLAYGVAHPADELGQDTWRHIHVADTFLEVDMPPVGGGETLTIRVDGDFQEFFFRQGRTPADTLASSATSQLWYLVEWHDEGRGTLGNKVAPAGAEERTTWSSVKSLFR